jgi:GNAT superfamily N-acetyltransferase
MTAEDLSAVSQLATRIHPAFPEDDAVFAERLRLYPDGCRVFGRGPDVEAYVVGHPWRQFEPPALNSLLGELPAAPSTFYIHDLALAPDIRGIGAAPESVAQLADCARSERLPTMSLVAVNGSAVFWRRQGFETVRVPELAEKLRTYDNDAQFMVRDLG